MPTAASKPLLDAANVVHTVGQLQLRIDERFPDAGLSRHCQRLARIAEQASQRSHEIGKPILGLRLGIALLIVLVLAGLIAALVNAELPRQRVDLLQLVQVLESAINDVVFVGIAIFFLATLEVRVKRRRALAALDELRSLAHVIDMHQLTKDPERVLAHGPATPSSPVQPMSLFELRRYLDYCSEMLALIGKLAALYVQHFGDSVALAAVNEIEELTTGLSQKTWQKIMILHSLESAEGARSTPRPRSPA